MLLIGTSKAELCIWCPSQGPDFNCLSLFPGFLQLWMTDHKAQLLNFYILLVIVIIITIIGQGFISLRGPSLHWRAISQAVKPCLLLCVSKVIFSHFSRPAKLTECARISQRKIKARYWRTTRIQGRAVFWITTAYQSGVLSTFDTKWICRHR